MGWASFTGIARLVNNYRALNTIVKKGIRVKMYFVHGEKIVTPL
jgi:hypothetical protein